MERFSGVPGRLLLVGAALLFSTGGAVIKACSLGGWQIAGLRSGLAAAALALLLPRSRSLPGRRTLCVSAAYAAVLLLFVLANKLTTAANSILLQSTAPLYLIALGPRLLGERPKAADYACFAAMAAGLALFFAGEPPRFATAPDPFLGNFLALGAGLAWALTLAGLRWAGRSAGAGGDPAAQSVVWGNAAVFLLCARSYGGLGAASSSDWLALAYLGVFQIGLAYVFLTRAMREVPALEASLLLLLEPVLNPVWAWAAHGEYPGTWAAAGGALIIAAAAARSWAAPRAARRRAQAGGLN